jgi:hypothetical protein
MNGPCLLMDDINGFTAFKSGYFGPEPLLAQDD